MSNSHISESFLSSYLVGAANIIATSLFRAFTQLESNNIRNNRQSERSFRFRFLVFSLVLHTILDIKEKRKDQTLCFTTESSHSRSSAVSTRITMSDTNRSKWVTKYQQIEECLRGDDDNNMIDLWELRELSLSYGGLLDPKLRKRAWPILTQAMIMTANKGSHDTTSSSPVQQQQQQHISIASKELLQIQKDVKRTVWNVKAHFRSQQQQQQKAASQEQVRDCSETNRRVKFFVVDNNVETSTSHSNEEENVNSTPDQTCNDDILYDDSNTSTMSSSFAGSTNSRRSNISSKLSRSSTKASKHEQRTVTNVIVSCLRTIPQPAVSLSSTSEQKAAMPPQDHRLHYYSGFHDLTALVMVNVESLSISALLLYVSFTFRESTHLILNSFLHIIISFHQNQIGHVPFAGCIADGSCGT